MTQPQNANADAIRASSRLPLPSIRETTLAPPIPNRLAIADRNMNAGIQTVTAVIFTSEPVSPTK